MTEAHRCSMMFPQRHLGESLAFRVQALGLGVCRVWGVQGSWRSKLPGPQGLRQRGVSECEGSPPPPHISPKKDPSTRYPVFKHRMIAEEILRPRMKSAAVSLRWKLYEVYVGGFRVLG